MYVQVVTFGLNGLSEDDYHQWCASETQTFASLPGLLGKMWLRDPDSNTYGGAYLWRDRAAYEGYIASEVFAAIGSDSNLVNVKSTGYDVFEDLTKETQPALSLI